MNDFLPPKRPLSPSLPPPRVNAPPPKPLIERAAPQPLLALPKKRSKKALLWVLGSVIGAILLSAAGAFAWYKIQLSPVAGNADAVRIQIVEGDSPTQIGQLLEEKKIIRSRIAFDIYTRLINAQGKLQAGVYRLSPTQSTEQITTQLIAGDIDQFSITFLPGATLAENRAGLIKAGFSVTDVDAALSKTYDSPLFVDKPASADLEGYIYGETYRFDGNASVEQILTRTFKEYYTALTDNNLLEGFKKQGLTLYQAIILASIIQREVPSAQDQKQVAQIFFSRLAMGMTLGSDVTYQYAAKKLGIPASPSLDSPYNTRKYPGLPPGPIATPGLSSLKAVAAPAPGDYLFFLSGDDGVTYFARTSEEHDANIRDHCQTKCLAQ